MTKWFEIWHKKQESMKHALRDTYVHRILGERVFHHGVWALDIDSLAGGLSLGLFVAFTPTIPFHMLLGAIGAILLRVNLPIALAASWVMNPLTAIPIFLSACRIGRYFFEHSVIGRFALDLFNFESRTGKFMEASLYLWTGSLFFSIVFALLGNAAARLGWRIVNWFKSKREA
ncbi:MAG: DUF2062 domain-containing protein [Thermodesulfobacteriota bacterium]|jgi:uncharacterized protein (DUF2062 family)|nr:MAG: DUF2062 domain-containing protein [Thermodesulfobacteriota bacterium]